MTRSPLTISPNIRFSEAEIQMRNAKVSALVVKNDDNEVVGILQIYDL
jgi:arabinose-5-phosphate isomerase